MTFIAISTSRHRADIATDTLTYATCGQSFGRTSKVSVLHHLATAVVTQGDHDFGVITSTHIALSSQGAPDFDTLVDDVPLLLEDAWEEIVSRRSIEPPPSTVYLVGYSPARQSFVTLALPSEHDFEPLDLDDFHVVPSPLDVRPSDLELDRLDHTHPTDLETLRNRPLPKAPKGRAEWIELAKRARLHRSLTADVNTGLKVLVAGELYLTRLDRSSVSTTKVHTFNDSGEEFQQLVAGTYHPQAQLAPCNCGSRKPLVECCMRSHYSDACLCGSGKVFEDCCRVEACQQAKA